MPIDGDFLGLTKKLASEDSDAAWTELHKWLKPILLETIGKQIWDKALQKDILQEALIAIFRVTGRIQEFQKNGKLQTAGEFEALAKNIAGKKVKDHIRRLHAKKRGDGVAAISGDSECLKNLAAEAGPDWHRADAQFFLVLLAHLMELAGVSKSHREMVIDYEYNGLSDEELAAEHKISKEGVRAAVSKAKSKFNARLPSLLWDNPHLAAMFNEFRDLCGGNSVSPKHA